MKKLKFQDSTFAYLGSKKKQASSISSFIDPAKHKALVSPFAGACSLELFVKHRLGLKCIVSDYSFVSYIAQRSLIANNGVKIERPDLIYLFTPNENPGLVKKKYSRFFSDQHCEFLDTSTENIRRLPEGAKKYLLFDLVCYFLTHALPFGKLGATYDTKNVREKGLIEALQEASNSSESRVRKLIIANSHPLPVLEKLANRINAGIISNNKTNHAYLEDAYKFLALPEILEHADESVLFCDFPYAESSSYHSVYDSLSEILLGREVKSEPSVFNSKEIEFWYDKFFELAQPYDLWLFTMGAKVDNPNALHSARFLKMVQKHRPNGKLLKFENFNWSINTLSGKSPKECEEFLVIAER